jgi:hypothetical protein
MKTIRRSLFALLLVVVATTAFSRPPRCANDPNCFCYDATYTGGDSCCGCGSGCYVVWC